jgi:hypothetical protein
MNITYIETSKLIPYARNNKTHNERQIKLIANSIKEFGFKNPVIVGKDNVIVAGHGRVLAGIKVGLDKVPCVIADDLTKAQIKAYRIADNKLADLGEYDWEMLNLELAGLKEMDCEIDSLGIDLGDDSFDNLEYSGKNKEINVGSFKDEMILKLKFTEERYNKVTERLSTINEDLAEAVWGLLYE